MRARGPEQTLLGRGRARRRAGAGPPPGGERSPTKLTAVVDVTDTPGGRSGAESVVMRRGERALTRDVEEWGSCVKR